MLLNRKTIRHMLLSISLLSGMTAAHAQDPHNTQDEAIQLSDDLVQLLREEMRNIAQGMQALALSIATADWQRTHDTSRQIYSSYIMKKSLTAEQAEELARLPHRFKQMDADFHQRAKKLAEAAADHDAEMAVYHYGRLLESCTHCHGAYAKKHFQGFLPAEADTHTH